MLRQSEWVGKNEFFRFFPFVLRKDRVRFPRSGCEWHLPDIANTETGIRPLKGVYGSESACINHKLPLRITPRKYTINSGGFPKTIPLPSAVLHLLLRLLLRQRIKKTLKTGARYPEEYSRHGFPRK